MIYFFNMNIAVQRNMSDILGFERKTFPTKYLGVPLTDKEGKYTTRKGIIIKLQDKVKIWTYRALNFAV